MSQTESQEEAGAGNPHGQEGGSSHDNRLYSLDMKISNSFLPLGMHNTCIRNTNLLKIIFMCSNNHIGMKQAVINETVW